MKRNLILVWVAAVLGIGLSAAAEPVTYDELIAEIDAKAPEVESLSFDFVVSDADDATPDTVGKVVSRGALSRAEMTMTFGGNPAKATIVVGSDGIQWIDLDQNGMKIAMKIDPAVFAELEDDVRAKTMMDVQDGASQFVRDPRNSWRWLSALFDLKVTGTETYEGTEVYVLEGGPKEEYGEAVTVLAGSFSKIAVRVGVEDGFPRRADFILSSGVPYMIVELRNLKFDVDTDGIEFEFAPAEGAPVMDMTPMIQQKINMLQQGN